MSQPRDLWPEEIAVPTIAPPVAILREQAELLAAKTRGLVEGEVTTAAIPPISPLHRKNELIFKSSVGEAHEIPKAIAPKEPTLVHSFYLRVPALDNYRFLLLTVMHGREYYPLSISYYIDHVHVQAKSEPEFLQLLRDFLSHENTIRFIKELMAQIPAKMRS